MPLEKREVYLLNIFLTVVKGFFSINKKLSINISYVINHITFIDNY